MTTWYDYMVRASEHAGSDGDLWFRYLYKVIKDEETKLTTDDVEQLLKNPTLTPFQKITLQDALTEGTHTREHVLQANRKSQPKEIKAGLEAYERGECIPLEEVRERLLGKSK